jgi:hypothetical protein
LSFIIPHRLLSGVVISGLCCGRNIEEGDVAEPRLTYWRAYVSLRDSNTILVLCAEMAAEITAETVLLPDSPSDLSCIFMHPKTRYQVINRRTAYI